MCAALSAGGILSINMCCSACYLCIEHVICAVVPAGCVLSM